MAKMNEEVKKKWVAALRSGEYKQITKRLKQEFPEGGCGYCCLGVLTDLFAKEQGKPFKEVITYFQKTGHWNEGSYTAIHDYLPVKVAEWAELNNEKISRIYPQGIDPVIAEGLNNTCSKVNDHGEKTFNEIAAMIEERL